MTTIKRVRATGGTEKMICPHCGYERLPAVMPGAEFVAYPRDIKMCAFVCDGCQGIIPCKSILLSGEAHDGAVYGYWPLFAIELDEGLIPEGR